MLTSQFSASSVCCFPSRIEPANRAAGGVAGGVGYGSNLMVSSGSRASSARSSGSSLSRGITGAYSYLEDSLSQAARFLEAQPFEAILPVLQDPLPARHL